MNEKVPEDIEELPEESFMKTLDAIRKKPGNKYQFITESGGSLKAALLNLFKIIWKSEIIPLSWHESTVTQIYKGRGLLNDLSSMRNIHSRDIFAKFFCQIVLNHAKDNLFNNMSKYQIACKPGHRPSEHLYALKSVFAEYQKNKKRANFERI